MKFLSHVYALKILLILELIMFHQFYSHLLNTEVGVTIKDRLQHLIQYHYYPYLLKDSSSKKVG